MSVSVMICNPINDEECNFNIPISTEKVFQEYWVPIIEKLDLKWVRCFQSGIEIEKENLKSVLKELKEMQDWVVKYMSNEKGQQIKARLENLIKELMDIFNSSRNDIRVYIG